jgi:1,4-dihydroxy-2-naphthoate octaprenyltransferase
LHWRADQVAHKFTPVVALGERGARIGGAILLLLIAITFLLDAFLQVFPWYTAVAALTVIPVLVVLRQAHGHLKGYLRLMATNLNANLLAALLILVALFVRSFAHI